MRPLLFLLGVLAVLTSVIAGYTQAETPPIETARSQPSPGLAPGSLGSLCEYGIAVALMGRTARAESVFVEILSRSPSDPRALNNLGNVALLRGDADLALSFYARAADRDSADAGIILNQATALNLLGDEPEALGRASEGIRRAGGAQAAGDLLGLEYSGGASPKGSSNAMMSRDELISLLRAAAGQVPSDSTVAGGRAPASTDKSPKPPRSAPVWRSAGARAGNEDSATLVYWKR